MPEFVSKVYEYKGRERTLVTATWKVTSVICEGVLLEIFDLISMTGMPGCPLLALENSQATSMTEFSRVTLNVEGNADAKSHSSSWLVAVLEAMGTGF